MTTPLSTAPSKPAAHFDGKRAKLRALVTTIEGELSSDTAAPLRAAWLELVTALDLGPDPDTRVCPACGSVGMRAASRCGHCWAPLS